MICIGHTCKVRCRQSQLSNNEYTYSLSASVDGVDVATFGLGV